jgi:hypothetical protein
MNEEKILIGRSDKIDLPDLGITNISAKIDTGAYTSSIHCSSQKVTGKKKKILTFKIVDSLHTEFEENKHSTNDFTERNIKNSFGHIEKRYIIKTKILIFNKIIETEFSLSNRSNMRHPILLGRKLLKSRFIVDVSKFNLSYKKKRKKNRKKI